MSALPVQREADTTPSEVIRPALDLGPDAACECSHPFAPCGKPRQWLRVQTCRCENRRGYCQTCHDIIARAAALALALDPHARARCVHCDDVYFVFDVDWVAI